MSEILTKLVWDGNTGEQTVVPLTPEEIADREAVALAAAEEAAAREAEAARIAALKASAITKLTTGENLTAEEAALIIL